MQARRGRKATEPGLGQDAQHAPKITLTRKKVARSPIAVDEVGENAVKLAAGARERRLAPRMIMNERDLASAPLDPRDAFVLSFVDGYMPVESIVDASGLSEGDVEAILERLAGLGIVLLP